MIMIVIEIFEGWFLKMKIVVFLMVFKVKGEMVEEMVGIV